MGGASAERDVSLRSGGAILKALRSLGYDAVGIDAGPDVCQRLQADKVEIAFLALHGGAGEDGSMQGLLEVMGIPYTGSGVLGSALAMDKPATKKVLSFHGVPVPRFRVVEAPASGEPPFLPAVVKPSREGSSIGVSIARDSAGYRAALETALSFGGPALVEEYVQGREVHIGILGGRVLGGVEVRPERGFYDYAAKYDSGSGTRYILPPELDGSSYEKAKETALAAHRALGLRGASRVDLIVDAAGQPYVLEANTIPGMTETSLLPKIARHAGLDFPALIEEILKEAVQGSGGR